MTYRGIRRAQVRTRTDREQWAAHAGIRLDTVFEGTGEALFDVQFGQAFDAPPFFSFSSVRSGESTGYPEAEAVAYAHRDNGGSSWPYLDPAHSNVTSGAPGDDNEAGVRWFVLEPDGAHQSVELVGYSKAVGTDPVTFAVPGGTQEGDWMIVCFTSFDVLGYGYDDNGCPGWSYDFDCAETKWTHNSTVNMHLAPRSVENFWIRQATASEPSTYSAAIGGYADPFCQPVEEMQAFLTVWRGAKFFDEVDTDSISDAGPCGPYAVHPHTDFSGPWSQQWHNGWIGAFATGKMQQTNPANPEPTSGTAVRPGSTLFWVAMTNTPGHDYSGGVLDTPPGATRIDAGEVNENVAGFYMQAPTAVSGVQMNDGTRPVPVRDMLDEWNWSGDPSFEHQGMYVGSIDGTEGLIPTWLDNGYHSQSYFNFQYIDSISAGAFQYPYDPTNVNAWVQGTRTHSRWALSQDRALPVGGERYQGSWSAKYTFDSTPESRWLVPVAQSGFEFPYAVGYDDTYPSETLEFDLITKEYTVPTVNATYPWGDFSFGQPVGNPHVKFRSIFHAWSDQALTAEVHSYVWGATTDFEYAYTDTIRVPFDANKWTKFTHDIDDPPGLNIQVPFTGEEDPLSGAILYYVTRIRFVDGVPGQVVYVDEHRNYPVVQTRNADPFLTLGVAEWRRDENGMYVGATVWAKTKDWVA